MQVLGLQGSLCNVKPLSVAFLYEKVHTMKSESRIKVGVHCYLKNKHLIGRTSESYLETRRYIKRVSLCKISSKAISKLFPASFFVCFYKNVFLKNVAFIRAKCGGYRSRTASERSELESQARALQSLLSYSTHSWWVQWVPVFLRTSCSCNGIRELKQRQRQRQRERHLKT